MENFDFIPIKKDVSELNDYEAIIIYTTSGANKHFYESFTSWCEFPIYMRENGVKTKILHETDNDGHSWTEFPYERLNPYVDGYLCAGWRDWETEKPIFYVQFPIVEDPSVYKKMWKYREEKIDRLVAVAHFNASIDITKEIASKMNLKLEIIGKDIPKMYGDEYMQYIADSLIAIEYQEGYYGWSRFGAECSYVGTPVIGYPGNYSVRIANEFFASDDIPYLVEKGERLIEDPDFYDISRDYSYHNMLEHLSPEACTERYKYALRSIGVDV